MSNNKLVYKFNKHFQENFWLYIMSTICLCTGVVLGIYTIKYMGNFDKNDLSNYLKSFVDNMSKEDVTHRSILKEVLKTNIPMVSCIWFLGLTMIGIPIVLIIDIVKGYTIGFTTAFMIKELGSKGMFLSLLGVIPQNIIYIPCIIVCSILSMEFSIMLLKDRINKHITVDIWSKVGIYSFVFIAISIIMTLGFLIESYFSPNMIRLIVLR